MSSYSQANLGRVSFGGFHALFGVRRAAKAAENVRITGPPGLPLSVALSALPVAVRRQDAYSRRGVRTILGMRVVDMVDVSLTSWCHARRQPGGC
jgi:hypothetical protein